MNSKHFLNAVHRQKLFHRSVVRKNQEDFSVVLVPSTAADAGERLRLAFQLILKTVATGEKNADPPATTRNDDDILVADTSMKKTKRKGQNRSCHE